MTSTLDLKSTPNFPCLSLGNKLLFIQRVIWLGESEVYVSLYLVSLLTLSGFQHLIFSLPLVIFYCFQKIWEIFKASFKKSKYKYSFWTFWRRKRGTEAVEMRQRFHGRVIVTCTECWWTILGIFPKALIIIMFLLVVHSYYLYFTNGKTKVQKDELTH